MGARFFVVRDVLWNKCLTLAGLYTAYRYGVSYFRGGEMPRFIVRKTAFCLLKGGLSAHKMPSFMTLRVSR